jgi:hypothetical protein
MQLRAAWRGAVQPWRALAMQHVSGDIIPRDREGRDDVYTCAIP